LPLGDFPTEDLLALRASRSFLFRCPLGKSGSWVAEPPLVFTPKTYFSLEISCSYNLSWRDIICSTQLFIITHCLVITLIESIPEFKLSWR
jgi:hypothetical protein